jgi:hypothetical protein
VRVRSRGVRGWGPMGCEGGRVEYWKVKWTVSGMVAGDVWPSKFCTCCMNHVCPPVKARSGSVASVKRVGAQCALGRHGVAMPKSGREMTTPRVVGEIEESTSSRRRRWAAREARHASRRVASEVTGSMPASRTCARAGCERERIRA